MTLVARSFSTTSLVSPSWLMASTTVTGSGLKAPPAVTTNWPTKTLSNENLPVVKSVSTMRMCAVCTKSRPISLPPCPLALCTVRPEMLTRALSGVWPSSS